MTEICGRVGLPRNAGEHASFQLGVFKEVPKQDIAYTDGGNVIVLRDAC